MRRPISATLLASIALPTTLVSVSETDAASRSSSLREVPTSQDRTKEKAKPGNRTSAATPVVRRSERDRTFGVPVPSSPATVLSPGSPGRRGSRLGRVGARG